MLAVGIIVGVSAILYFMGWHTEVLGGMQRLFLSMGLGVAREEAIEQGQELVSYNFKLADLEGKSINFEDFKGKTIFFNIWATWCPPCIAEMPNINELYKETHKEVVFVMLSTDEDTDKVHKFIERKGFSFPVYKMIEQLPGIFWTQSIPTTFVISPEGKIVLKKLGISDYNTKEFKGFLLNL